MAVQEFLAQAKVNAEKKSQEMASLELKHWNTVSVGLEKEHGFTNSEIQARKNMLINKR